MWNNLATFQDTRMVVVFVYYKNRQMCEKLLTLPLEEMSGVSLPVIARLEMERQILRLIR